MRQRLACRAFIRESSREQHLWKGGRKRKQNWAEGDAGCNGVLVQALGGPAGGSGAGMIFSSWGSRLGFYTPPPLPGWRGLARARGAHCAGSWHQLGRGISITKSRSERRAARRGLCTAPRARRSRAVTQQPLAPGRRGPDTLGVAGRDPTAGIRAPRQVGQGNFPMSQFFASGGQMELQLQHQSCK